MKKIFLLLSVIIVLSAQLISAEDLGSELVDCYNFNCSSSNWIIGSGFRIINTSSLAVFSSIYYPNSSSLHQEISLTPNEKYKIILDIKTTWFDWHNFWVELGGVNSSVYNSSGIKTFYLIPTTNQNLTLWVNRTYTESINANVIFNNISVKELFKASNISFGEGTEESGSIIYTNNIYVNVSIAGSNFQNITYSLYNQTSEINKTTFTSKIETINWTDLNDGLYFYNVTLSNSTSSISTETRNITIEASTNVSWCREIWKDNVVYTQTQDIEANGDTSCISISGTNVTFEGNGFKINNGGIFITSLYNSTINNTDSSKITVRTTDNNLIKNSYIHNCSNECISIGKDWTTPSNNEFRNIILNNSNDTGIAFSGVNVMGLILGSANTTFKDIQFLNITNYDVYMPTISSAFGSQENKNVIFINSSYSTEYVSGANNQLTRKWYYQVYINNTNGEDMENINVTILDKNNNYLTNITTNSLGLSEVIELTDYYNNAGSITYYSNYSIFAEKTCYPSYKVYHNITEEKNTLNVLTLGSSTYQNWDIDCSKNCVIDYPITINYNISLYGGGLTSIDSNLTFLNPHWQIYKEDGCDLFINNGVSIS